MMEPSKLRLRRSLAFAIMESLVLRDEKAPSDEGARKERPGVLYRTPGDLGHTFH
jgi:hypothetical protein